MADLAGNPAHTDHESWLTALGRATYEAALLAVHCFDIMRVWESTAGAEMLRDDLGRLQQRLVAVN
jgi:hypothetical protein